MTVSTISRSGRWNSIAFLVCIGLLASGCASRTPGAPLYVKLPVGATETDAFDDMRSKAVAIAVSLGFEPSPYTRTIGLFESYPDGRTMLVLAVFRLREDQEVYLGLRREYVPLVGTTLGLYLSDEGVVGSAFRDNSIAKKTLLELHARLRDEFGADRIYLTDWAQQQLQQ